MRHWILTASLAVAASVSLGISGAKADEIAWAMSGDALTLDPHSQNEGPTHTINHQVYEPLLHRNTELEIVPALATDWGPTDDPTVWEFTLREGVSFHNGNAFTAEDVVFSLNRAKHENSDMRNLLTSIVEVRAVDEYTVHVETDGPNPLLPNNLTNLFMMDSDWAAENNVETPQNYAAGEENYATRNAMGTGAFRLVSREADVETVFERNEDYWGMDEFSMEITRMVFTPIQNSATRVAALLSGELDLILEPPVQDLQRIERTSGVKLASTPQNRVIFFGMNQAKDDLEDDSVDGANPFADVRVRRAMNMAIDREAIQQVVMRGQSDPTGIIAPPFVNGWTEELDQYPEHDVEEAMALMEEAGYGDGFDTTLYCPNDRYINDEAICEAFVGMMADIDIGIDLVAQPKSVHFEELQNGEQNFYMLGWGVPTFDSHYIFTFLAETQSDTGGSWNFTGFSNDRFDELVQQMPSVVDEERRNEMIQEAWEILQENRAYLPIHNQIVNWAMAENINFPAQGENQPHFKYLTFAGGS